MRIIHCADLHLDSPMSNLSNLAKENSREIIGDRNLGINRDKYKDKNSEKIMVRKQELFLAFRKMVDYAINNSVEAIIIAGDMFDKKKPSATAVNYVLDVIRNTPSITFYYLMGNHDSNVLASDEVVAPDNLRMFGSEWTYYNIADASSGCGITICGCEFTKENAGMIGAPLLDLNNMNIAVLHGDAGENSEINLRILKGKGIDYLALGHIHSYRYERLDQRGALCYPGCLESRGFDECGTHGFVVLDVDCDNRRISAELIEQPIRTMYRVGLDISECNNPSDIFEKAREQVANIATSADDMVLLELIGNVDINCDKNTYMLEQYLASNYFMVRVHDCSEYRVRYEDYELDESLKGEFVRAVLNAQELSEEDKAAVIRMGIRALRGEAII